MIDRIAVFEYNTMMSINEQRVGYSANERQPEALTLSEWTENRVCLERAREFARVVRTIIFDNVKKEQLARENKGNNSQNSVKQSDNWDNPQGWQRQKLQFFSALFSVDPEEALRLAGDDLMLIAMITWNSDNKIAIDLRPDIERFLTKQVKTEGPNKKSALHFLDCIAKRRKAKNKKEKERSRPIGLDGVVALLEDRNRGNFIRHTKKSIVDTVAAFVGRSLSNVSIAEESVLFWKEVTEQIRHLSTEEKCALLLKKNEQNEYILPIRRIPDKIWSNNEKYVDIFLALAKRHSVCPQDNWSVIIHEMSKLLSYSSVHSYTSLIS